MHTMVRLRTAKWLAWFVVGATAIPYMASGALAATKSDEMKPQSVVVFPLGKAAEVTKSQLVAELNAFLVQGMASCRGYSIVEYTERLPAAQRLATMQLEKKSATTSLFSPDPAGIARATVLAKAMAADLFLVGSVDNYEFKEDVAKVTAAVQVADAKTGKVVQTIVVTGRGTKPSATASVAEPSIASEAVKDAGRKIIGQITGQEYKETRQAQPVQVVSKKSSKKSWIPLLLLSLGVGLLLGGSGGGDNGGGGGGNGGDSGLEPPPPPPPLGG